MDLPQRTYHYEPKDTPSDEALIARIGDLCLEFPRYGYRRVTKQLQREGWAVNHKKVARIMRERNWSCRPRKKRWIATTNSNHGLPVYPNLTKGLSIRTINQLWVADITYIRILHALCIWQLCWMPFHGELLGMPYQERSIPVLRLMPCGWP